MKPSPTDSNGGWSTSEERLIIDTAPTLIHTALPDGLLDFFNKRWLEYLGVGLKEVQGWNWTDLIHPDDVDELVTEWRRSLKTGVPLEVEARVRGADGKYRWFLHRKCPLHDEQGSIVRWYGSSVDIDDRKRAEDALQTSQFYLKEGQRLCDSGSWSFTPDLVCDYWSPHLYEILGFDAAKGIPTIADYLAIVHPDDREMVRRYLDLMIAKEVGCDFKKRIVRPNGQLRVIRCVGVPVFANGKAKRFIGTLMDVSEQEHLNQELRRREVYLTEAQRLSRTGSFGWNLSSREIVWSEEIFRILEYDPSIKPTLELIRQRVHPEDRTLHEELVERAIRDKKDFASAHRLLMPSGAVKYVSSATR